MYIKPADLARWGGIIVLSVAALWLLIRYVLPWMAPFIAAFLLARLLEPLVKMLCRRGWSREFASGMCTLALLGLVVMAAAALVTRGAGEISALSHELPSLLSSAAEMISGVRQRTGDYLAQLPPELSVWLDHTMASLAEFFASLPARISEKLLEILSAAASAAPSILLFTVTCGIGIYFISAAYPGIQAFLDTHLPEEWQRRRVQLNANMRFTLGRYVRAQFMLMIITFFELLAAFLLLRIEGALLLSLLVAVLDALPILGAGAILLPWAAFSLILGDPATGLGLLITWGVVSLVRNAIQAKLLGDQFGLHPLITLITIYVGWCAAGVWGMVLFPMGALTIKQLGDSGLLKLWEREHEK
ncbi:MAG: sporulation integral membrane protein YtvI [Oscillospiraceae bacterium]